MLVTSACVKLLWELEQNPALSPPWHPLMALALPVVLKVQKLAWPGGPSPNAQLC